MSGIPEAVIHQRVWSSPRLTAHAWRIRIRYGDCPARSSTPEDFQNSERRLLAGQSDGDLFRYATMGAPCHLGTVAFSHTRGSPGLLKTRAVAPGHDSLCPGACCIARVATTSVKVPVHPDASQKGKSRAQRVRLRLHLGRWRALHHPACRRTALMWLYSSGHTETREVADLERCVR
jgi:hypothetical protein